MVQKQISSYLFEKVVIEYVSVVDAADSIAAVLIASSAREQYE